MRLPSLVWKTFHDHDVRAEARVVDQAQRFRSKSRRYLAKWVLKLEEQAERDRFGMTLERDKMDAQNAHLLLDRDGHPGAQPLLDARLKEIDTLLSRMQA